MPLDESIVSAVANSNFKTNSELASLNAISHQNRLQLLAESSLGLILERMNTLGPVEASAVHQVNNSNLASKLSELSAAISNTQQMIKGAQSTPPQTAIPG